MRTGGRGRALDGAGRFGVRRGRRRSRGGWHELPRERRGQRVGDVDGCEHDARGRAATGVTSRSIRSRRKSSPATRTARATCSCAISSRARTSSSRRTTKARRRPARSTDPVISPNGRYVAFVSCAVDRRRRRRGERRRLRPARSRRSRARPRLRDPRQERHEARRLRLRPRRGRQRRCSTSGGAGRTGGLKSFCGVSTDLVSVDSNESQGPSVSRRSRWSRASPSRRTAGSSRSRPRTQMATGDANNKVDVYLRDRDTDADDIYDEPESSTTLWISGGSINAPNGASLAPSLSDDGSLVAFESTATNLAGGRGRQRRRIRHLRQERQDRRADAHHERGRRGHRAVALRQRRTRRVPTRHRRDRDRQRRHHDSAGDPADQDRHEARARERRQLVRVHARRQQVYVTNVTGGATELMSTPGGGTHGQRRIRRQRRRSAARSRSRQTAGSSRSPRTRRTSAATTPGVRDIFVRVRGGSVSAFSESRRRPIPTAGARGVAIGDVPVCRDSRQPLHRDPRIGLRRPQRLRGPEPVRGSQRLRRPERLRGPEPVRGPQRLHRRGRLRRPQPLRRPQRASSAARCSARSRSTSSRSPCPGGWPTVLKGTAVRRATAVPRDAGRDPRPRGGPRRDHAHRGPEPPLEPAVRAARPRRRAARQHQHRLVAARADDARRRSTVPTGARSPAPRSACPAPRPTSSPSATLLDLDFLEVDPSAIDFSAILLSDITPAADSPLALELATNPAPPGTSLGLYAIGLLARADFPWEELPFGPGGIDAASFALGQHVTYTLQYTATGFSPQAVTITATLPAGAVYVAGSAHCTGGTGPHARRTSPTRPAPPSFVFSGAFAKPGETRAHHVRSGTDRLRHPGPAARRASPRHWRSTARRS